MKKLIQLDRLDGNRKGVIKRIAEEGKIMTNLYQSFSADQITNPEIFPSLLFYYGMLTIIGTRGNLTILEFPTRMSVNNIMNISWKNIRITIIST